MVAFCWRPHVFAMGAALSGSQDCKELALHFAVYLLYTGGDLLAYGLKLGPVFLSDLMGLSLLFFCEAEIFKPRRGHGRHPVCTRSPGCI
mgnify:CR=1 FL=1